MVGPELIAVVTRVLRKHTHGTAEVIVEPEDRYDGVRRTVALTVRFRSPGRFLLIAPYLAEMRAVGGLSAVVLKAQRPPHLEFDGVYKGLPYLVAIELTPAE